MERDSHHVRPPANQAQASNAGSATPLRRAQSWRPSELMQRTPSTPQAVGVQRTPRPPHSTASSAHSSQPPSVGIARMASADHLHDLDDASMEELPAHIPTEEELLVAALVETEAAARRHEQQSEQMTRATIERRRRADLETIRMRAQRQRLVAVRTGAKPLDLSASHSVSARAPDPELLARCPWKTPTTALKSILKTKAKGGKEAEATRAQGWRALRDGGVRQRLKAMRVVKEDTNDVAAPLVASKETEGLASSRSLKRPDRRVRFSKAIRVVPIPPRDSVIADEEIVITSDDRGDGDVDLTPYMPYDAHISSSDDEGDTTNEGASAAAAGGDDGSAKRKKDKFRGYQDRAGKRRQERAAAKTAARALKDAPLPSTGQSEKDLLQQALTTGSGAIADVLDNMLGESMLSQSGNSEDDVLLRRAAELAGAPAPEADDADAGSRRPSLGLRLARGASDLARQRLEAGNFRDRTPTTPLSPLGRFKRAAEDVADVVHQIVEERIATGWQADLSQSGQVSDGSACFGRHKVPKRDILARRREELEARRRREAEELLNNAPRHRKRGPLVTDTTFFDREREWQRRVAAKRAVRQLMVPRRIVAQRDAEVPPATEGPAERAASRSPRPRSHAPLAPPPYLARKPAGTRSPMPDPVVEAVLREVEEAEDPSTVSMTPFHTSMSPRPRSPSEQSVSTGSDPSVNSMLQANDGYTWQRRPLPPPRMWRAYLNPRGADGQRLAEQASHTARGAAWRSGGHDRQPSRPHFKPAPLASGVASVRDSVATLCGSGRPLSHAPIEHTEPRLGMVRLPEISRSSAVPEVATVARDSRVVVEAAMERLVGCPRRDEASESAVSITVTCLASLDAAVEPPRAAPSEATACRPQPVASGPPQAPRPRRERPNAAEAATSARAGLLRTLERLVAGQEQRQADALSNVGSPTPPPTRDRGTGRRSQTSRGTHLSTSRECARSGAGTNHPHGHVRPPGTHQRRHDASEPPSSTAIRDVTRAKVLFKDLRHRRETRTASQPRSIVACGPPSLTVSEVQRDPQMRSAVAAVFGVTD